MRWRGKRGVGSGEWGVVGTRNAACDELVTLTNAAGLCPLTDTKWHDALRA
jgi:hypothetical protein